MKNNRGAVLIVALVLSAVVAIGLTSYMRLATNSVRLADRTFYDNAAMNLADAGLEQALWSMNTAAAGNREDAWKGWQSDGTSWWKTVSFALGGNTENTLKIHISSLGGSDGSKLRVVTQATVKQPGNGPAITKGAMTTITRKSLFSLGIAAQEKIRLKNVTVDSYDSRLGSYDAILSGGRRNRFANARLASLSTEKGAISLDHSDVHGYIMVAGEDTDPLDISKNATVGDIHAAANTVDQKRISTSFTAEFAAVPPPTGVAVSLGKLTGGVALGWPGGSQTIYEVSSIDLGGNTDLVIQGPVVLLVAGDMKIGGSAGLNILPGGSLRIYSAGKVEIGASADVGEKGKGPVDTSKGLTNANPDPRSLQIYGTTDKSDVRIKGNGNFAGVIYSPLGSVKMSGSSEIYGALVAKEFDLSSNAKFHYDESLIDLGTGEGYGVYEWTELATPAQQSAYAALLNF